MSRLSDSSVYAPRRAEAAELPEAGPVRGALRAWLARLSAGDAAVATPSVIDRFGLGYELRSEEAGDAGRARAEAGFEYRVRRLRANARAAFHSVEGARAVDGPDAAALDAALAVIEAEWRSALSERDGYAETLKAIRLYASDARSRAMAERGLSPGAEPPVLPWTRRAQSMGAGRYPFADEFDA